jgi:hypothetical protein
LAAEDASSSKRAESTKVTREVSKSSKPRAHCAIQRPLDRRHRGPVE